MPGSLRCKLSKLRHKGQITAEEYEELIKKLDGHDRELYDKAYAEGKSRQLFAEIKIDKDMMQKMIDEKIKEFEVDIQATRNAAIDEFAEKCKERCMRTQFCMIRDFEIDEIAEQMKGGAIDE